MGNAPLASLSPDLLALSETRKAADDLANVQLSRRHQLNALLGLAPDAELRVAGETQIQVLDIARVRRDLASIADRRPDLVALQYGYRSQDAQLRQAILSQFPNLVVGVMGGRDTSMVYSAGPEASFDLPIFDHNEGNIAAAQATRTELQREFAARVTATAGEVEALLSEQALLRRQLVALDSRLHEARLIAGKTELAFAHGDFDDRAYVDIEVSLLTQEQQKLALQQALAEQQVALATLTGAGLPQIDIPPAPPPADPLGLLRAVSR
jgi:outer membrane protein TolC